jgi:hypothetical protein
VSTIEELTQAQEEIVAAHAWNDQCQHCDPEEYACEDLMAEHKWALNIQDQRRKAEADRQRQEEYEAEHHSRSEAMKRMRARAALGDVFTSVDVSDYFNHVSFLIKHHILSKDGESTPAWIKAFAIAMEAGAPRRSTLKSVLVGALTDQLAGIGVDWYQLQSQLQTMFLNRMDAGKNAKGEKQQRVGVVTAKEEWSRIFAEAVGVVLINYWDNPEALDAHLVKRLDQHGNPAKPVIERPPAPRPTWSVDTNDVVERPRPPALIEGLVTVGSLTLLEGKYGTYKSATLVGWAHAAATGTHWCGHEVPEAVPVVYVAAEDPDGIEDRLFTYKAIHGPVEAGMLTVLHRRFRFNKTEDVEELMDELKRLDAKLVIIDTWAKVTAGLDTNGELGASTAVAILDDIREKLGATVVVATHTGYGGEHNRGSSLVEDDADTVYLIQIKGEDRRPSNPRTLTQRKARNSKLADPRQLELMEVGESMYVKLGLAGPKVLDVDQSIALLKELGVAEDASNTAAWEAVRDVPLARRATIHKAQEARRERVDEVA